MVRHSLQGEQDNEQEPCLMRGEKVYKATTRMVKQEMQGLVQTGGSRNKLSHDPAEMTAKLLGCNLLEES